MGRHLDFSEHLTKHEGHDPIKRTYLGQAHIAGTGPLGTTCRECAFWGKVRLDEEGQEVRVEPGFFGKRHPISPFRLKDAFCLRPILNKAERLIPHDAPSCRLFVESEAPPPAIRPDATAMTKDE